MKNRFFKLLAGSVAIGFLGTSAWAGELTYAPVNPNFGGSPFNATPLLSNANAQNGFEAPPRDARDFGADFAERLDRTILSRISRALTTDIIDPDTGELITGEIVSGINLIDIVRDAVNSENIVTITNTLTGETTTIRVPFTP